MRKGSKARIAALAAGVMASAAIAATDEERIAELERKVEALTAASERGGLGEAVKAPLESVHGMGPAASKVYHMDHGVSLGGYGEMTYINYEDDQKTDELDFLRWVLYTGYKYNDKLLFNSEIEIEHAADDKKGEVAVEFAYLDYLHAREFNLRAGLLLVPMGLLSELHEPTTFLGARRPDVENRILPSTWRENGIGAFGDIGPFSYNLYLVNGFDAAGFTDAGLRGGRQKGSKSKADDFAVVGRLDYTDLPGLIVGGSAYYGDSGQDLDASVNTFIYEGHVDGKWRGWEFRALAVAAELDDVAALNEALAKKGEVELKDFNSIGEELTGWYVEVGFDLLSVLRPGEASLTPFIRYEEYDTQASVPSGFKASGKNDVDVTTVGVNFKPIPEVVVKADYQFYDNAAGTASDQWNASLGYVF